MSRVEGTSGPSKTAIAAARRMGGPTAGLVLLRPTTEAIPQSVAPRGPEGGELKLLPPLSYPAVQAPLPPRRVPRRALAHIGAALVA